MQRLFTDEAILPTTWQDVTQTPFSPYFPEGHTAIHKDPVANPVAQVETHAVVEFYP